VLGLAFAFTFAFTGAACGSAADDVPTTGDPTGGAGSSHAPADPPKASDPVWPDDPSGSSSPSGSGAPYPIVFMHGMSGFGRLQVGPVGVTYFDGVVEDLTKRGESVFVTVVPPFDTSEERAKALATQIDTILARTGKAKVNLVGHSQGGMDARVIASPAGLGYGDRVASVTTIATPHHGSKVADAVLGLVQGIPTGVLDDVTGAILELAEKTAFELDSDPHLRAQVDEISESYMNGVFNPKYVDDPRVAYSSYAGRTNMRSGTGVCDDGKYPNDPTKLDAAQPLVAATAIFLEEGEGKVNDGLVTVESSKWGTFLQCVPADHLKEVGQIGALSASFDHLAFFRTLVARIRAAGY
jgi:triacylglycerol lipase